MDEEIIATDTVILLLCVSVYMCVCVSIHTIMLRQYIHWPPNIFYTPPLHLHLQLISLIHTHDLTCHSFFSFPHPHFVSSHRFHLPSNRNVTVPIPRAPKFAAINELHLLNDQNFHSASWLTERFVVHLLNGETKITKSHSVTDCGLRCYDVYLTN